MNTYRVRLTFTAKVDAEDTDAALTEACERVRTPHELVDWEISFVKPVLPTNPTRREEGEG